MVYEVYQASESKVVEAEVLGSYFGNDDGCYLEVELKILSTDEEIVIGDDKPGDISTCRSEKKVAAMYQPGERTFIFLSKSGKYHFAQGSYLGPIKFALFCSIWIVLLYLHIKLHKTKELKKAQTSSPN